MPTKADRVAFMAAPPKARSASEDGIYDSPSGSRGLAR